MQLLCPHCSSPVDVPDPAPGAEVSCPSCGSSFSIDAEPPTSLAPDAGKKLGKFHLLGALGSGAFGTVYKARDPELDRTVALKVPHAGQLAGQAELERFRREARAVAQLKHANIVQVHDVGLADGVPFLVCEFVNGVTLTDLLSAGRPGFRETAELVAAVADALHYAHDRGVVHRDVKPSNILIDDNGQPHITDFGLARRDAGEATLTQEGQVIGTPAYMPPEQAGGHGHDVDARGDVYSLGVVLYKMLTGELPFRGTAKMLVQAVQKEEPRPPRRLNDRVPRDLETITLKAMAKEPNGRFASARDFADDLRRWVHGEPIRARPISAWRRGTRWVRRNPAMAAMLAMLALTTGVTIAATVGLVVRSLYVGELRQALDEANTQRARAEDIARRSGYRLGFSLAQQAFDAGFGGVAVEHLSALRPEDGAPDLRGFEWYHLWRECHRHWAELPGHKDTVRAVAFSPDGSKLATAGFDGVVRLFERATWALRWERPVPKGTLLQAVAFRRDGVLLASGGGTEAAADLQLWDLGTGEPRGSLPGHTKQVTALVFTVSGQLISASMDGTLKFWDVEQRKELASFALGQTDHVRALALSPDGATLAVGGINTTLRLWNVADRKQLVLQRELHRGPIWAAAFSPDGKHLVTGSYDGRIGLWDPVKGTLLRMVEAHTGGVNGVAFHPKENTLISAGVDQTIRGWRVGADVSERFRLRGPTGAVVGVAVSPDGALVATGGSSRIGNAKTGGEVKLWDVGPDAPRDVLPGHRHFIVSLAFSPNGHTLASGSADRTVRLWDFATGRAGQELAERNGTVYGLAFTPDGWGLFAAAHSQAPGMQNDGGELTAWDPASGKIRLHLRDEPASKARRVARPLDTELNAVAVSPDSQLVALGGSDGTVRLRDQTGAKELARLTGHTAAVRALAFSPKGDVLASADGDGTARLWDVASRTSLRTLEGHDGTVWSVQFSPDGATVVTSSSDRLVRFWDAATGKLHAAVRAHTGPVRAVTFSPDGRRLASAGADQRVVFWDAETREPVAIVPGGCGGIWAAAFAPKGQALAVAGEHRVVRVLHAAQPKE